MLMLEMPTLISDGCAALSKRTVREPDSRIEHRPHRPGRSVKVGIRLRDIHRPTSDTCDIAAAVVRIFERIWRNCYRWRKAGVLLLDLGVPGQAPASLLDVMKAPEDRLMPQAEKVSPIMSCSGLKMLRIDRKAAKTAPLVTKNTIFFCHSLALD